MKPMLAAEVNFKKLEYPVLVSPKLDGVRAYVENGIVCSRTSKPIPNKYVQEQYGNSKYEGLDGELIVGDATADDCFRKTTSVIMSKENNTPVRFLVFDSYIRTSSFKEWYEESKRSNVYCAECSSEQEVRAKHYQYKVEGYEGSIIRKPNSPYKHGRSTQKEGYLLKMKDFVDGEAVIERMISEKTGDGTERQRMGAIDVRDIHTGQSFMIGTGFTDEERDWFWNNYAKSKEQMIIKYKYQPSGIKEKPRFPVYLGIRCKDDL